MSARPFRLLAVGVGGQGVVTAARLLGDAARRSGVQAMVGELHGMSQRGGSVETTLVIGKAHTSFVGPGAADVVLALEPLEALRACSRMSARTHVVVCTSRLVPSSLSGAGKEYPDLRGVLDGVRAVAGAVTEVDGDGLSAALGDARGLNMMMLGALVGLGVVPIDERALLGALEDRVPVHTLGQNRRAFELGREAVSQ